MPTVSSPLVFYGDVLQQLLETNRLFRSVYSHAHGAHGTGPLGICFTWQVHWSWDEKAGGDSRWQRGEGSSMCRVSETWGPRAGEAGGMPELSVLCQPWWSQSCCASHGISSPLLCWPWLLS